jgi:sialate O-acetylesterase
MDRQLPLVRALLATVTVSVLYLSVPVGICKADVFTDVPEAADYSLVYTLGIPDAATNFNANPVPYSADLSNAVDFPFDRVAYHLELQSGGNPHHFVCVSVDAFTGDATRIGVPTVTSGAFFQRALARMNVVSNAPDIVTGTDLDGGWIEL